MKWGLAILGFLGSIVSLVLTSVGQRRGNETLKELGRFLATLCGMLGTFLLGRFL